MGQGGVGPISRSAISQYAMDYGITGDQRELMFLHIRALDNVYLEIKSAEDKRELEERRKSQDHIRHVPE